MPKPNRVQIIKYAPPPPELPVFGKVKPEDVSFIGRTNYVASLEEKKFIFGIKRIDRRRHFYIVGKSGVGKSKFLELLMRQDITYNHGLCFIDPHGDVIEAILDYIPKERIEKYLWEIRLGFNAHQIHREDPKLVAQGWHQRRSSNDAPLLRRQQEHQ